MFEVGNDVTYPLKPVQDIISPVTPKIDSIYSLESFQDTIPSFELSNGVTNPLRSIQDIISPVTPKIGETYSLESIKNTIPSFYPLKSIQDTIPSLNSNNETAFSLNSIQDTIPSSILSNDVKSLLTKINEPENNPTNPDNNLYNNISGGTRNSKDLQNIHPKDANDRIQNPIDDSDSDQLQPLNSKSNEQTENDVVMEANQTENAASKSIENIIPQKQKNKKSSKFNTSTKSSIISKRINKINSTKMASTNEHNMSIDKSLPKKSSFLGSKARAARDWTSLECRICKKSSVSIRLLRNHERAEHKDVLFPFKCNICLGGFGTAAR